MDQMLVRKTLGLLFMTILLYQCNRNGSQKPTLLIGKELLGVLDFGSGISDNTQLKVVRYVNFDCGNCVQELLEWQEFIDESGFESSNFLVVAYSMNGERHVEYIVREVLKTNLNVYYDRENEFYLANNLIIDRYGSTAALNRENHTLLIGDPLVSLEMKKKYLSLLSE